MLVSQLLSFVITDTTEYKTIISCTAVLRTAVQSNLTELSGHLLGQQLITSNSDKELRNGMLEESTRAAKLVELIQNKVELNPDNYHAFIKALEEDKQNYQDILKVMKEKYNALTEGD